VTLPAGAGFALLPGVPQAEGPTRSISGPDLRRRGEQGKVSPPSPATRRKANNSRAAPRFGAATKRPAGKRRPSVTVISNAARTSAAPCSPGGPVFVKDEKDGSRDRQTRTCGSRQCLAGGRLHLAVPRRLVRPGGQTGIGRPPGAAGSTATEFDIVNGRLILGGPLISVGEGSRAPGKYGQRSRGELARPGSTPGPEVPGFYPLQAAPLMAGQQVRAARTRGSRRGAVPARLARGERFRPRRQGFKYFSSGKGSRGESGLVGTTLGSRRWTAPLQNRDRCDPGRM